MAQIIVSLMFFLFCQILINPKFLYVKEEKPKTGGNEPVSTESTTAGAPTNSEGIEGENELSWVREKGLIFISSKNFNLCQN